MRSGETLRRDTVRFLLAAIQNEEKGRLGAAVDRLTAEGKDEAARQTWLGQNKPSVLDDAAIEEVLTKQAKMRRDSIDAFRKGGRNDLVEKEEKELAFINAYLPAQLDESKIREIARRPRSVAAQARAGATDRRRQGRAGRRAGGDARRRGHDRTREAHRPAIGEPAPLHRGHPQIRPRVREGSCRHGKKLSGGRDGRC